MRRVYVWLSLVIGIALFAAVVASVSWSNAWNILSHANPTFAILFVIISAVILFLHSVRWYVILKSKQIDITFWTAFSYVCSRFAVSFVTPGPRLGGEAVGAGLLTRHKRKGRKLSFGEALSTIAIDRSIELQMFALLFFIGVFALAFLKEIPPVIQVPIFIVSGTFLVAMIVYAVGIYQGKFFFTWLIKCLTKKPTIVREANRFERTVQSFYREERGPFIIASIIAGVAWLLSIIEYKYILLLLGYDAPIYAIFVIYSFVGLAYLIPIPLALGSLEGTQAAAFAILGLSPSLGVILALIIRLRDILFSIFGFIILGYHGITPRSTKEAIR